MRPRGRDEQTDNSARLTFTTIPECTAPVQRPPTALACTDDKAWTRTTSSIATAQPTFPSGRRLINRQRICYEHLTRHSSTRQRLIAKINAPKLKSQVSLQFVALGVHRRFFVSSRLDAGPAQPRLAICPPSLTQIHVTRVLPATSSPIEISPARHVLLPFATPWL
jgi:hypothetical protein